MKIIWLKTGPLHPLDTGGKIRTFNMLRELKKRHQVTYLALCQESDAAALASAGEYSHEQIWIPWRETRKGTFGFYAELCGNLFSSLPYAIAKYRSQEMAERIGQLAADGRHDLMVCDFLTPAINLRAARTPVLLFEHNVESQIWERLAQNARGPARIYFREQWRRMENFERKACAGVAGVVGVSEEDCGILREKFGLKNVLGAVPTGVDVDYFAGATPGTKRSQSMVFLGSMDWMPNIDAAKFFVGEIFPLIKQKFPDATVALVGRNPPAAVRALESAAGVQVTGTVPDVRPHLGEAEVMIVPLRVGGGTRIKIFEGMAAGLPVVSTRIGAEGLPVRDGENIFLADTPEDFAARVGQLFNRAELRGQMGGNGLNLVRQEFGWEAAARRFENYGAALTATG